MVRFTPIAMAVLLSSFVITEPVAAESPQKAGGENCSLATGMTNRAVEAVQQLPNFFVPTFLSADPDAPSTGQCIVNFRSEYDGTLFKCYGADLYTNSDRTDYWVDFKYVPHCKEGSSATRAPDKSASRADPKYCKLAKYASKATMEFFKSLGLESGGKLEVTTGLSGCRVRYTTPENGTISCRSSTLLVNETEFWVELDQEHVKFCNFGGIIRN